MGGAGDTKCPFVPPTNILFLLVRSILKSGGSIGKRARGRDCQDCGFSEFTEHSAGGPSYPAHRVLPTEVTLGFAGLRPTELAGMWIN